MTKGRNAGASDEGKMRVLLIRHGVSAYSSSAGLIDAAGVQRWREGQDAAGIRADSTPPPALVERVALANVILASDLARAVESAERLAPGRPIEVSPLLRESETEIPTWLPGAWPLRIWRLVSGTQWFLRILLGTEVSPSERERAAKAARLVADRAREHGTVAVVFHGGLRRLLARRLAREGWTLTPGAHSYRHWSVWELTALPSKSRRPA